MIIISSTHRFVSSHFCIKIQNAVCMTAVPRPWIRPWMPGPVTLWPCIPFAVTACGLLPKFGETLLHWNRKISCCELNPKKTRPPSWTYFNKYFRVWSRDCYRVTNVLLYTKFDQNGMIFRWDMEIWWFLPCDAMHSAAISVTRCLSVRLSVTFVSCAKTNKDIFEFFSPSGSDTILVFPYHRGCRYYDGNPLTGASNTGGMIKCRFFHKYLAVSQKRLYLDGHMQRDNL